VRRCCVLLRARPRSWELFRIFNGLRVGEGRAGLGHPANVSIVPQDFIVVGLVVWVWLPLLLGGGYASEAKGVRFKVVIQNTCLGITLSQSTPIFNA